MMLKHLVVWVMLGTAYHYVVSGQDVYPSAERRLGELATARREFLEWYTSASRLEVLWLSPLAPMTVLASSLFAVDLLSRVGYGLLMDLVRFLIASPFLLWALLTGYMLLLTWRLVSLPSVKDVIERGSGLGLPVLIVGILAVSIPITGLLTEAPGHPGPSGTSLPLQNTTAPSPVPSPRPDDVITFDFSLGAESAANGPPCPPWCTRSDPPPEFAVELMECSRLTADNRAALLGSGEGRSGFLLLIFWERPLEARASPLFATTLKGRRKGAPELSACAVVYDSEPLAKKLREAFFVDLEDARRDSVERMFDRATGRRYAPTQEDLSPASTVFAPWDWTHEVMDGKRTTIYASAERVPYPGYGVREIVASEHDALVEGCGRAQVSFIMYYAPWCGQCKKVEPEVERLAEAFSPEIAQGQMVVGRVDFTKNAIPGIDARGYPHFVVHESVPGHPVRSRPYSGERTADAFIRFLKDRHDAVSKAPAGQTPTVARLPGSETGRFCMGHGTIDVPDPL